MYIGIMSIGFIMSSLRSLKQDLLDFSKTQTLRMVFNLPNNNKIIYIIHWPQQINTVLRCKMRQYLKPPHPSLYPLTFIYFIQYIWDFSNLFNLILMSHELLGNLLRGFSEGDIHLSSVEMGHILSTGTITLSSFWRVK